MVLGEHGRRMLYPMTPIQASLTLPWSKLYKQSLYFRTVANVMVGTLAVFTYVGYKGWNVWFTPYDAVHHSINHKFIHDHEAERYPIDEHKKH